jgi:hypothetical protein
MCLGVRLRFVLFFAIGTAPPFAVPKSMILIAISVYRTLRRLPGLIRKTCFLNQDRRSTGRELWR